MYVQYIICACIESIESQNLSQTHETSLKHTAHLWMMDEVIRILVVNVMKRRHTGHSTINITPNITFCL